MAEFSRAVSMLSETDKNKLAHVRAEFRWGRHVAVDPRDGVLKWWEYWGRVMAYRRQMKDNKLVEISKDVWVDRHWKVTQVSDRFAVKTVLSADSFNAINTL